MKHGRGSSTKPRGRSLDRALVALMCVSVLGSAGYMWWNSPEKLRERRTAGPLRVVPDWERFAREGHIQGPSNASLKFIVFMDYQCPGCRAFHDVLSGVAAKLEGMAVVYRHYPLPTIHPHARAAALAAECADAEDRFWQLSDRMFELQDSIGSMPWTSFARDAQVADVVGFERCLRDSTYLSRVDRDISAGGELGIPGTPSFLVNGRLYTGARTADQLRAIIAQAGGSGVRD